MQMLAVCICLTNVTGSNHEEISTNRDTLFLCVFWIRPCSSEDLKFVSETILVIYLCQLLNEMLTSVFKWNLDILYVLTKGLLFSERLTHFAPLITTSPSIIEL